MKCDDAQTLMAMMIDGPVSEADSRALREHLNICESCKQASRNMQSISAAFARDKEMLLDVHLSSGFSARLHQSLVREQARRNEQVIPRLAALLDALPAMPARTLQILRAAAVAAVLVAAFLGVRHSLVRHSAPVPECRLGHVSAFTARPTSDGRVYASVTARTAVGRTTQKELYLK